MPLYIDVSVYYGVSSVDVVRIMVLHMTLLRYIMEMLNNKSIQKVFLRGGTLFV